MSLRLAGFDKVVRADIAHDLGAGIDLGAEDLLDLANLIVIEMLVHDGGGRG